MAAVQLAAMVLSLLAIISCVHAALITSAISVRFLSRLVIKLKAAVLLVTRSKTVVKGGEMWEPPGRGGWFGVCPVAVEIPIKVINAAKPQANLAEITINASGQDLYDLSNVVSAITDQCLRVHREFSEQPFAPEFPGSVVIINQSAQMRVPGPDLAMTTLPDLFFDLTRLKESLHTELNRLANERSGRNIASMSL